MTDKLLELSTSKLLTKFGSGGHKPGSGSAAALLGLVACKLIQTVITLSSEREQYRQYQAELILANEDILGEFEPLLIAAVQEDSEQFDKVILAMRMRDGAINKASKRQFSQKALEELRLATDIPLRIAGACIRLAEKGLMVFDFGFKGARGDSGVAISSALAAASGCLSIIFLNLTSFKGSEWAKEVRRNGEELSVKVQRLQVELFKRIEVLKSEAIAREGQT